MTNDPIVSEIHQFREQLLAQHQGSFAAYFAALQAKQALHPEQYASFATTSLAPSAALPALPSK